MWYVRVLLKILRSKLSVWHSLTLQNKERMGSIYVADDVYIWMMVAHRSVYVIRHIYFEHMRIFLQKWIDHAKESDYK